MPDAASPVTIFAVPCALCARPAVNSLATDAAIGSFPLNRGNLPGSLIVPIDRTLSLSRGQPSMPIPSIAATPIDGQKSGWSARGIAASFPEYHLVFSAQTDSTQSPRPRP
jgi:hypothetical protein